MTQPLLSGAADIACTGAVTTASPVPMPAKSPFDIPSVMRRMRRSEA